MTKFIEWLRFEFLVALHCKPAIPNSKDIRVHDEEIRLSLFADDLMKSRNNAFR